MIKIPKNGLPINEKSKLRKEIERMKIQIYFQFRLTSLNLMKKYENQECCRALHKDILRVPKL